MLKRGGKMGASRGMLSLGGGNSDPSKDKAPVGDEDGLEIEAEYDGAHLYWPLRLDNILQVLDSFKHGKVLHLKYTRQILQKVRRVLAQMSTCQDIPVVEGVKLTICGDVHGQLQDLFSIFTINGLPSATNQYLFNGDFVDRGDSGVEVVLTLALFKLLCPESVWLNRGNHESRSQNSWMGFEEEVLWKYNANGSCCGGDKNGARQVYALFQTCFDNLPLCSVVASKIFVVHGGLFARDGVTLTHLKGIKRKREPPLHGSSFEEQLMEELLWSDPRPIRGRQQSERGAGVEFGQDVTNNFCSTNRIALVIRSHECVQEGFQIQHGGRLITLFSASRYCGTQTNKGAFLTLGHDLQPEIQQFYAHSIHQTAFTPPQEEELETRLEDDAIKMILERVVDQKSALYWYFTKADVAHKGELSRVEWAQGMKSTLALDLPFLSLQPRLCELEKSGNINYTRFLERYRIEMTSGNTGWHNAVIDRICRKLYKALGGGSSQGLAGAFRLFDADADGFVEYEEFMSVLKELDIGLTDEQIYELMRSVDTDKDSLIDFKEFAARFEMTFNVLNGEENFDDWTKQHLSEIGAAIYSQQGEMDAAFAQFDKSGEGNLTYTEFSEALNVLGLNYTIQEGEKIAKAIDADASGCINYAEFVAAFKVADTGGRTVSPSGEVSSSWQSVILQQVSNVLYQHRIHIRSAFRMFDLDNSGNITPDEFSHGLGTINSLLDSPLTPDQIDGLLVALDRDGDGCLSYTEFFDGFRIIDMEKKEQEEAAAAAAGDTPESLSQLKA